MRHPPLAIGWIDRPHHERSIGDLPLAHGGRIEDCRLVWVEHGERRASNTVLVLCAIGSTHHRLDFLIGPGRALDTDRYHVIAIDALGNGVSSSPSNSATQPGAAFPRITIADMVESQRRLLDALGIGRLHGIVGASMGGMQALRWAVDDPGRTRRVVAMTAMARTARWSQLMNELSRRALFEDDAFTRPRERSAAMRLWVPLTQRVTPLTPQAAERFADADALIADLRALQERFEAHGPDPFDWLCQTRAYDSHDVADRLGSIRARVLLAAPPLDLYNPEPASREMAAAIPHAEFVVIPSELGHRAATDMDARDAAFLNGAIARFLQ